MSLSIKDIYGIDTSGDYIVETNVTIPLRTSSKSSTSDPLLVRANVYRPHGGGKFPVLVTYGPYGKDVPYSIFHPKSFAEVNPEQKSAHSAWETPDPAFWTSKEYVVVRADERGTGQSPGRLDSMSEGTSDGFFDVVEWAAEQLWSNGKVGLLGISYYAGSQWRVAARRPKGLAAIVPWEGMSDLYRDRVRHGGILSNTFISWWWNRQVVSNQYGLPGRAVRNWGPDTLEGNLSVEDLKANREDQTIDTARYKYRDDEYYISKDYKLEDIEVPVLSVANWGGILLHLRGNVVGYMQAGSGLKYLRFITGRHDLPFYDSEEVQVQKSFLDAFLKGEDKDGWSVPGKIPAVDICLRVGNLGVNNPPAELAAFPRRQESEWPIARSIYRDFYLTSSRKLSVTSSSESGVLKYEAPIGEVTFETDAFTEETEITGHPLAHLVVSLESHNGSRPTEMDIFLTIRHYDANGQEGNSSSPLPLSNLLIPQVFYTGTTGEPCPVVKGWQRLSLRKIDDTHPSHRSYLPHRNYFSTDVQKIELNQIYPVDVEIWPTNVVVGKGHKLALQIASHDTQGSGLFEHNHPEDRAEDLLKGLNCIHIGNGSESYLRLPIIPAKEAM